MTKRIRLHVNVCRTCGEPERSLKKGDECEHCELQRLRAEMSDIRAELQNFKLNGSNAVKQIRGLYADLEATGIRLRAVTEDRDGLLEGTSHARKALREVVAERDMWKERAEFAVKDMYERLDDSMKQFIASRKMHHATMEENTKLRVALKDEWVVPVKGGGWTCRSCGTVAWGKKPVLHTPKCLLGRSP